MIAECYSRSPYPSFRSQPSKIGLYVTNVSTIPSSVCLLLYYTFNLICFSLRLDDLKPKNPLLNPLVITSKLHYKEDKTLQKATIECINPKMMLKRSDSVQYRKRSASVRSNYQYSFTCEHIVLQPGTNDLCLEFIAKLCGTFKLGQVSLIIEEKLEFLCNALVNNKVGYDVVTQGINVYLNKIEPKKDLVAGLEHAMELVVSNGSSHIEEVSHVTLEDHREKTRLLLINSDMRTSIKHSNDIGKIKCPENVARVECDNLFNINF